MDIAIAADKAADYIQSNGWQRFSVGYPGGKACIRGAILWANGLQEMDMQLPDTPVMAAISNYLELSDYWLPDYYPDAWIDVARVVGWNNAEERTQDEIVNALRGTANANRS